MLIRSHLLSVAMVPFLALASCASPSSMPNETAATPKTASIGAENSLLEYTEIIPCYATSATGPQLREAEIRYSPSGTINVTWFRASEVMASDELFSAMITTSDSSNVFQLGVRRSGTEYMQFIFDSSTMDNSYVSGPVENTMSSISATFMAADLPGVASGARWTAALSVGSVDTSKCGE